MVTKKVGFINSNILVAVDGSPQSEKAVQTAIPLAQALKASLTFLCVIDISTLSTNASSAGVVDNEIIKVYHDEANKVVNRLLKKYPFKKTKALVKEGLPADAIVTEAKKLKANMIVMGTHGRKGISHFMEGSVAEHVVRNSNIPVVVVPGPKPKK